MDPKTVINNTIYLYIRMILVLLVNLYVTRIVVKFLGIEDFGIYNIVGSIVIFFSFLRTALTNATSRYLTFELGTGNKNRLVQIFSMAINSHLLLAIILFVFLEIGGLYFLNFQLVIPESRLFAANIVFQFSIFSFCISIIQTPFHSCIIAYERMNFYAILSVLEVIFKLAIAFYLAYSSFDKLITYGFLTLLLSVIVFSLYYYYCRIKIKDCVYIKYWNTNLIRDFSKYSGWSLLVNSADIISVQCISFFFNIFVGLAANAALGIANQISSGILAFSSNVFQAFQPQIVKSYAGGEKSYFMKLLFAASKVSFIMMLVVGMIILCNIEFLLSVWLGDYPPMVPMFVKIILLYYLIDSFQNPLCQAVHATGRIKNHQIMISSIKFLVIPMMYLALAKTKQPNLALGAWAFGNIICAISRTIYMKYLIGLDLKAYFFKVFIKIVVVSIILILVPSYLVSLIDSNIVAFITSSFVIIVLSSFIVIYYLFDENERKYLKAIPVINKFVK